MDSLDLLWGIGTAIAVAFIAYGAVLCVWVDEPTADEVNSSHADSAPRHSPG